MHVIDLEGGEYSLQATSTNEGEINGNQSFSAMILPTKVNKLFINEITEMWNVVDHDDVEHKIIYCKKKGEGNSLTVDVKAIPLFFDVLDNDRIYERYDEHMTANLAFNRIFEDTGFGFVLNGSFSAVDWEGFGDGESKLETFKRAINRYKCEFRIVGNTVYLENQIGRDTQFMYRHRLNASNIVQEIDANEMWTYARGYGDYEDSESESGEGGWENAKLVREYTSPLAQIIGIRHAPPIKDGRVKVQSEMDASLKTLVDESLKVSVSADIHDLRKQGYPLAQSELGDRVFLIDERIDLNDEVRVVAQSITRNWKGEVIDLNITFGSEGIAKRHQGNITTAIKNINELLAGKVQLPFSVLDDAVKNATKLIQNANTELQFPNSGGIIAVDPNNPNYLVSFTSRGIGVSEDGGATFPEAITGLGINASVVTTGTMLADRIAGGILESLNGRTHFNLNTGELDMQNTSFTLGGGASIKFTSTSNQITYGRHSSDNVLRTAGLGVGTALGNEHPYAYLGTTPLNNGVIDTLSADFTGLIVNTSNRIREANAANTIVGNRARLINSTNYDKGITFDFFGTPTITMMNGEDYTYDMRYLGRISTRRLDIWNPSSDSDYGYVFTTNYNNNPPAIRGRNADTQNYHLGRSSYRFSRIFLKNEPDVTSDERMKTGIKEIDLVDEIVLGLEPLEYRYKLSDNDLLLKNDGKMNRGLNEKQYGFSAQRTKQLLDNLGVSDQSIVNLGEDNRYGMQKAQIIPLLVAYVQKLNERVLELEGLNNGTA